MSETPEEKQADVTTDPRRDDESSDWSDEGGATPSGPATDEDADDSARTPTDGDDA